MHETATRYLLILFAACFVVPGHAQQSEKWKQAIDRDDVQVYSYYCPQMQVRASKAVTILRIPIDTLEDILDEVDQYPNWQEEVTAAKVIHRRSDLVYHISSTNDQGFLARKHDLVWAVEKFWDERTASLVYDHVCSSNTLETRRSSRSQSIQAFVSWRLRPISETEIELTYMLTVDQNGKPPQWALGLLDPQSGFQTLLNLRNHKVSDDALTAVD